MCLYVCACVCVRVCVYVRACMRVICVVHMGQGCSYTLCVCMCNVLGIKMTEMDIHI